MSYYKDVYEQAWVELTKKTAAHIDKIIPFILEVQNGIIENAEKGYRIYGRDTAVDEVHMLAKEVGMEEGLLWGFLIRHFDQAGIEIQQTQFSVLFKIKDCI